VISHWSLVIGHWSSVIGRFIAKPRVDPPLFTGGDRGCRVPRQAVPVASRRRVSINLLKEGLHTPEFRTSRGGMSSRMENLLTRSDDPIMADRFFSRFTVTDRRFMRGSLPGESGRLAVKHTHIMSLYLTKCMTSCRIIHSDDRLFPIVAPA
jgi:hypothetical protein